jgi:hypothetical protein
MKHLRPCQECRRHVLAEETQCPFCNAALPEAPPLPRPAPGRFTRAAVFAGAAVIGAATGASACGGGLAKTETTEVQGTRQPFYTQTNGGGPTTADAGTPPPPPPPVDAGPQIIEREWRHEAMPYGAPPARDRIV